MNKEKMEEIYEKIKNKETGKVELKESNINTIQDVVDKSNKLQQEYLDSVDDAIIKKY